MDGVDRRISLLVVVAILGVLALVSLGCMTLSRSTSQGSSLEATIAALQAEVASQDPQAAATTVIGQLSAEETDLMATIQALKDQLEEPTPTSTPADLVESPADAVLDASQAWRSAGMEIRLADVEIVADGVVMKLNLTSWKGQTVVIRYNLGDSFSAEDNLGNALTVGCSSGPQFGYSDPEFTSNEVSLADGETITLEACHFSGTIGQDHLWVLADVADPDVSEIIVTVTGISTIDNARWRIPIIH